MHRKQLDSILVKPAGPDCNMDCGYCFYRSRQDLFPETRQHRMSHEILEIMIGQLMAQSGEQVSVIWQGGEPTLMGLDFYSRAMGLMQRYGRGQIVGNGLQTNGVLVDRQWARFFRQYHFLIGLSLDGPEHVHDRYRSLSGGGGSWTKACNAARLLLDEGVAVNALSVVNDYSAQFPEELYAFFKETGLNHMQFIPCVEACEGDSGQAAPFCVSAEAYGSFLCRIFDVWLEDFAKGMPTTSVRFFDAVLCSYLGMEPPECTLKEECGSYVVVEHNGDVYSCDFFVEPAWRLGNIRSDGLASLLNSEEQTRFGCLKKALPSKCFDCRWRRHCSGGCTKDRLRIPSDRGLNHFCQAFQMFFQHADAHLLRLAGEVKRRQAPYPAGETMRSTPSSGPAQSGKTGRNDPCPCGSGQKYKRCCGRT